MFLVQIQNSFLPFRMKSTREIMPMKLGPLYRVRFTSPHSWELALSSPASSEGQHVYLTEGMCKGRIHGRLRGANYPGSQGVGTYEPDFQGIIKTLDGAVIFFDYSGYGRAYPPERRVF
jgi:hypothetical protein